MPSIMFFIIHQTQQIAPSYIFLNISLIRQNQNFKTVGRIASNCVMQGCGIFSGDLAFEFGGDFADGGVYAAF